MKMIGRDDLGNDPALATTLARQAVDEIDAAIGEWSKTRTVGECLEAMAAVKVPGGRIFTIGDAEDPQFRARGMILPITTRDGLELEVPGVVPKLSATPGGIRTTAPALGEGQLPCWHATA